MAAGGRIFAVIGLGTFGSTVAQELASYDNHVIGIDIDDKKVSDHADILHQAMIVDARDDGALREAGLEACDVAVVAMASDMEASILAAMALKTLQVGTIWAKARSKNHHRILSKIGVDRVIRPEKEVGQHIAQVLHNPMVRDYVSLGNGLHVVNFRIPESLEGKPLDALEYADNHDLRCIGVMRGTEYIGRDGQSCTLERDDLLLLLGRRQDLRAFADNL